MSYKLKLNNKMFEATDADNRMITLPLKDDLDVIFFKEWQDKAGKSDHKKEYTKNIDFIKITESGTLKQCFPILNENETIVKIYYDIKVLNKNEN